MDYMRKMVQTAEMDRDNAIQRSTILAQQTAQHTSDEIRGQLDKLSGLERDHMKLTATQSIAEVSNNNDSLIQFQSDDVSKMIFLK